MGEEYFVTLRDVIKSYRQENNLSQRQFAINCSLSNGYISLLEKGINPKTKQPVTPTLPALKKTGRWYVYDNHGSLCNGR